MPSNRFACGATAGHHGDGHHCWSCVTWKVLSGPVRRLPKSRKLFSVLHGLIGDCGVCTIGRSVLLLAVCIGAGDFLGRLLSMRWSGSRARRRSRRDGDLGRELVGIHNSWRYLFLGSAFSDGDVAALLAWQAKPVRVRLTGNIHHVKAREPRTLPLEKLTVHKFWSKSAHAAEPFSPLHRSLSNSEALAHRRCTSKPARAALLSLLESPDSTPHVDHEVL